MCRMTVLLTAVVLAICAAASSAQVKQAPAFEVASVRLMSTPDIRPDRITDRRVDLSRSLWSLLLTAFRVKDQQLFAPAELKQVYVDVQATMPAGATVAQVPEMLQALLA